MEKYYQIEFSYNVGMGEEPYGNFQTYEEAFVEMYHIAMDYAHSLYVINGKYCSVNMMEDEINVIEHNGIICNYKIVEKTYLTIGKLKEMLNDFPDDDMEVFVGCQGYSNFDFKNNHRHYNSETRVFSLNGKLLITDSCVIDYC